MCQHHVVQNRTPLPFTCCNNRFQTDPRGLEHPVVLFTDGLYSLRLEHVIETLHPNRTNLFWLMWYDQNGCPLSISSAVFDRQNFAEMVKKFEEMGGRFPC
jgi:hypothetical protein